MTRYVLSLVIAIAPHASACLDDSSAGVADVGPSQEDVVDANGEGDVAVGSDAAGDTSAEEAAADVAEDSQASIDASSDAMPADTQDDTTLGDATLDDTTVADHSAADTAVADLSAADTSPADTTPEAVAADVPPVEELPRFSFFVTSYEAMQRLSGSVNGFGGDLRFGEETGLGGADKICATIAEEEMPGASQKRWRAFLSATDDGAGNAVHAIERIGDGPWYDRYGRLVANDKTGLAMTRPAADPAIRTDLPNERGEGQKSQPGLGANGTADNHDVLTGSNAQGKLDATSPQNTCQDWTFAGEAGRPRLGHSWPAQSGQGWIASHPAAGCAAVVNLLNNGPGDRDCVGVGCGGGYGAIYCFAGIP